MAIKYMLEPSAELAALAQRREQTRALKQAMMQELLTCLPTGRPAGRGWYRCKSL